MQALSTILMRDLQAEAAKVPPAEADAYYKDNQQKYEEAQVERLYIPKNQAGPDAKPPDDAALKAEADKIRTAALGGAAFAQLQKQVWDDFGIKTAPPPTDAGNIRRENVPASQAKVFALKPGEISEPLDEPGGIYLYKLISKKTPTQAEVAAEIDRALSAERLQRLVQDISGRIKPSLNDQYFSTGAEPRLENAFPPRRPAPGPAAPPTPPKQ